jgi:hypothetical protein
MVPSLGMLSSQVADALGAPENSSCARRVILVAKSFINRNYENEALETCRD